MKSPRWTSALVVACALLIACGQGGEQGAEAERQAAADTMTRETAAAGQEVSVTLSPKSQSGIRGRALLARQGDSVSVQLMLSGLEPGGSYPAHVHRGTCQSGGGVATALTTVSAQDSTGASTTTFAASAVSPDSAYFLQAHLSDGTPAACGNVPTGAFGPAGGM